MRDAPPPSRIASPLLWREREYVWELLVWLRAVRTCPNCLMPRRIEQFCQERERCDDCRVLRMVMASAEASRAARARRDHHGQQRAQDAAD